MQKIILAFLILIFVSASLFAQEEKKIKVDLHGFVKVDYFFDSRQTVAAREGHFLLFPQPASFDLNQNDINATPNFNILAIQTRLNLKISGPDVYGAKSSAFIEGAFFGHSNADVNGFRLRHAFAKLNWDNAELLMGQYWHPMFVTSCFPGVHSFNTGAPFQPFSRNPQVRLTYGKQFKLIGTLYSQRDFASRGPNGTSSEYLRNSGIPAMNLQVQFSTGNLFAGAGIDSKMIKPELSIGNEKNNTNLSSLAYIAFLKLKAKNIQFKVEGTYGENLADLLMLGGIADFMNQDDELSYTSFKNLALWSELIANFGPMELGLFGGYSQNLGINEPLFENYYSLGGNIASMWRGSIRTAWKSGPTKFGVEYEITQSQYGNLLPGATEIDITGVDPVMNHRLLVIAMYSF
jgi:hypothetical protein